jgi:hypothetical protein
MSMSEEISYTIQTPEELAEAKTKLAASAHAEVEEYPTCHSGELPTGRVLVYFNHRHQMPLQEAVDLIDAAESVRWVRTYGAPNLIVTTTDGEDVELYNEITASYEVGAQLYRAWLASEERRLGRQSQ